MRFRYFAYGSNLLTTRLVARCPSARPLGVAHAPGYALEFSKPGPEGTGAASIVPRAGATTPGVLYDVALSERPVLDRFESLGIGYDRDDDFAVHFGADRERVACSTYLARSNEGGRLPFDWYLALVVAGAEEHGLGAAHLQFLRAVPFAVDADLARERRIAAMQALADHGIAEPMAVLRGAGPSGSA